MTFTPEEEKMTVDELRACYARALIKATVKGEAMALGAIDPDDVPVLADLSRCSYDENSNVVIGAREAVEDLRARKPFLFGSGQSIENRIPPPMGSLPRGRRQKS